jgi:hypothetical protein
MNQLSVIQIDRRVIDLTARRRVASNVRRFAGARGNLPAAPAAFLACHWRRNPETEALLCVWAVSQGAREPASPVPLRRAS